MVTWVHDFRIGHLAMNRELWPMDEHTRAMGAVRWPIVCRAGVATVRRAMVAPRSMLYCGLWLLDYGLWALAFGSWPLL
jgi:hypothetical protein